MIVWLYQLVGNKLVCNTKTLKKKWYNLKMLSCYNILYNIILYNIYLYKLIITKQI